MHGVWLDKSLQLQKSTIGAHHQPIAHFKSGVYPGGENLVVLKPMALVQTKHYMIAAKYSTQNITKNFLEQ